MSKFAVFQTSLAAALLVVSSIALADKAPAREVASVSTSLYETKNIKLTHSPQYGDQDVSYIVLKPTAGPKVRKINFALSKSAHEMRCDADMGDPKDFSYNAKFSVVDITRKFVSISVAYDESCGGAHPDGGIESYVFDQRTAKKIDVQKEFGLDPALDSYDQAVTAISVPLKKYVPADEGKECISGDTSIDQLLSMSEFDIAIKGKSFVITVSPPHAVAACGYTATVPYSELAPLIRKGSVLHAWMK